MGNEEHRCDVMIKSNIYVNPCHSLIMLDYIIFSGKA